MQKPPNWAVFAFIGKGVGRNEKRLTCFHRVREAKSPLSSMARQAIRGLFLTGTVHSLGSACGGPSMSLAKLQVFASHPWRRAVSEASVENGGASNFS